MEQIRVDRSVVHCPFCKGDLDDVRRIVACAPCGARHHLECYREHGRCASCSSREKLVHRAAADYEIARAETLYRRTILSAFVVLPLACLVTWMLTVHRNSLPAELTRAQESLELERAEVIREEGKVTRARAEVASTIEAERAHLLAEHSEWLQDRAQLLVETAKEKETARQLARQGWHVAELVASASLIDRDSIDRLRQAEDLLPDGPSVLRGNIHERMDELWHPEVFCGTLHAR
jgi:hypothetical protein